MLVTNDRLQIIRGEDKQIIFKLREKVTRDPISLKDFTKIAVEFTQANRAKLILDSELRPARKASTEIGNVKLIADNAGGIGNSIILDFNGVHTLNKIVSDWNDENPENTVSHNGTGNEVFNGTTRLEGGFEAYRAVQIDGEPVLGRIKVNLTEYDTILLRRGNNQNINIIIDWGFPPSGTRRIARFDSRLDVTDPR